MAHFALALEYFHISARVRVTCAWPFSVKLFVWIYIHFAVLSPNENRSRSTYRSTHVWKQLTISNWTNNCINRGNFPLHDESLMWAGKALSLHLASREQRARKSPETTIKPKYKYFICAEQNKAIILPFGGNAFNSPREFCFVCA